MSEEAYRAIVYPCPCCTRKLKSHLDGDRVMLFCSNISCECKAMYEGESGDNAKEAHDKLQAQYELWAEVQP